MGTAGPQGSQVDPNLVHRDEARPAVDRIDGAQATLIDEAGLDALLGTAFPRSIVAMIVLDLEMTIRRANAAAGRLLATDDLLGRSFGDFQTGHSASRTRRFAGRFRSGVLDHLEHDAILVTSAGDRLVVEMRVDALVEFADPALHLVQIWDLTAIREHERALTASEKYYRDIVHHLPNGTVLSFDRQMRLLLASGELIGRMSAEPATLRGQRLDEILPPAVWTKIVDPVRAALRGESMDFDYSSPLDGTQHRLRTRPFFDDDELVVGGLILSEDVSAERTRQMQLEQMQELSRVGSCRFDASSGWQFDPVLLDLLGVDSTEEGLMAVDELVLPEDRDEIRSRYRHILNQGGRAPVEYRLRHGRTGELRFVRGTCDAEVDSDGKLLRAVITHADITESVYSRRTADAALAAAAQSRTVLLRRVSDLLATEKGSLLGKAEQIAEVAAAGLGNGALLRIMTADGLHVESDTIAHPDPVVRASVRGIAASAGTATAAAAGSAAEAVFGGALLTGSDPQVWADIYRLADSSALGGIVAHFIAAPVRHAGQVLGVLSVFRAEPGQSFATGDEDLVQVLADRVGAAIGESRMQEWLEQQRQERQAIAGRLIQLTSEQRELLDQLSEVEERERVLLAEAIHDDPMQLVIAVAMRLETLGMKSDAFGEELDELVGLLESAVERLRTLITALNPPDLAGGLGQALRRLAEGIFIGTPTRVHSTATGIPVLSAKSTETAFRIFREALVNARKHARATNVDLAVRQSGTQVVITLHDDGVGADSFDAGPGHLGMLTMRARAATEGGTLSVRSAAGGGTTVTLSLTADASAPAGVAR